MNVRNPVGSAHRALAITAAFAVGAMSGTARAQDAVVSGDSETIEQIIVTAQKRAQSAQDVPIALSAFSQAALDAKGVADVTGLTSQVPSLQFTTPNGIVQVTMRGAGNDSTSLAADNGVGFHYNGVYLGNAVATLSELWDVERVEVLRGPQGTLYGRNTTGGSINIIPEAPGNRFDFRGDATFGDYGLVRLRMAVNVPIADEFATRFAASRTVRDGFQHNSVPGRGDADDQDSVMLRNTTHLALADTLSIATSFVYSSSDDRSNSPVRVGSAYPGGVLAPAYALATPKSDDPRRVSKDADEYAKLDFIGGDLTVSADLGAATLKSITSYFDTDRRTGYDWDGADIPLAFSERRDHSRQWTQEVQLVSSADRRFTWILGASYYDFANDNRTFVDIGVVDSPTGPYAPGLFGGGNILIAQEVEIVTESWAVFGQGTYSLTDALRLTLGGRYTWDEKHSFSRSHPPTSGSLVTPESVYVTFPIDSQWSDPTAKVTLDYDLARESMIYVSYARGYKSGSLNPSEYVNVANRTADPEHVDAFEIGSKNSFFDRRLQLNLTGFYSRYTDLQINTFPDSVQIVVLNVPGARTWGLESEFVARPTPALQLDGSVGYIHSAYDDFVTGNQARRVTGGLAQENIGGNRLINTPDWTVALGAQYALLTRLGTFTLRGDFSYRSDIHFDIFGNADMIQKAHTKTNLRLGWRTPDRRILVEAYVQNLEDEDVLTTTTRLGNSLLGPDVPIGNYAPPRTFGVRIGFGI